MNLKIKNKFKRIMFYLGVKTPLTPLIIVLISVTSILYISTSVKVNSFFKVDGQVIFNKSTSNDLIVQATTNEKIYEGLNVNDKIVWYRKKDGPRYQGTVSKITKSDKALEVTFTTSEKEIYEEYGSDALSNKQESNNINIEIFKGQESILRYIMNK